jgi:hypothetical protein
MFQVHYHPAFFAPDSNNRFSGFSGAFFDSGHTLCFQVIGGNRHARFPLIALLKVFLTSQF